ncbi:aldo/keto reductase [Bartonella sp. LJL80]
MTVPLIKMNDGHTIPQLGYGVWKISDQDAKQAVSQAIKTGYRHIDTAKAYDNETGVGQGVVEAGIGRENVFIATKVWNTDQGFDQTLKAFDQSVKRLGTDYVDLYLIHWPVPAKDLFVETWKALIRLRDEKRVRSIGVCNFRIVDLERLMQETGVAPVLNQVELHPQFQQKELRIFHEKNNILTEAWAPLGRGILLDNPVLKAIADSHGKTVAQIILRWHMELGTVAIPKSQSPIRMAENFDIFDFKLTAGDHDQIAAIDRADGRTGGDPAEFCG